MKSTIFKEIIKVDILTMISESNAINSINHNGLKGYIREKGLSKFITKYLPFEWKVGHGEIQDCNGNSSSETDLLIYNLNILPPALFGADLGIYPIESCKYVFEVKTTSNAKEIKTTIDKFQKLQALKPIEPTNTPIRVYFAYKSDLKNEMNELERYKKYDSDFYTNPAIRVICVIGQGYWFYKQDILKGRQIAGWMHIEDREDYECVSNLIGGIINTLNGDMKPHFGKYILSKGKTDLADYKIL
jgi:hypothetical protein